LYPTDKLGAKEKPSMKRTVVAVLARAPPHRCCLSWDNLHIQFVPLESYLSPL